MHEGRDGHPLVFGCVGGRGPRVGVDGTSTRLVDVRRDRSQQPPQGEQHPAEDERERHVEAERQPERRIERSPDEPDDAEHQRREDRPRDLRRQREDQHAGDGRDVDEEPDPRLLGGGCVEPDVHDREGDEHHGEHADEHTGGDPHGAAEHARHEHGEKAAEGDDDESVLREGARGEGPDGGDESLQAEEDRAERDGDLQHPLDAVARERPQVGLGSSQARELSPGFVDGDRGVGAEAR